MIPNAPNHWSLSLTTAKLSRFERHRIIRIFLLNKVKNSTITSEATGRQFWGLRGSGECRDNFLSPAWGSVWLLREKAGWPDDIYFPSLLSILKWPISLLVQSLALLVSLSLFARCLLSLSLSLFLESRPAFWGPSFVSLVGREFTLRPKIRLKLSCRLENSKRFIKFIYLYLWRSEKVKEEY